MISLPYGPALTSVYDYWKNHHFDYMDFCWQSDVSVFNILSRFVVAFLLRNNCLLTSNSGDGIPKDTSSSYLRVLAKSKRETLSICRVFRKLSRCHKHHICIQCACRLYLALQEIIIFRRSVIQFVELITNDPTGLH